eukprot:3587416-Rhodomonas_salina.1
MSRIACTTHARSASASHAILVCSTTCAIARLEAVSAEKKRACCVAPRTLCSCCSAVCNCCASSCKR